MKLKTKSHKGKIIQARETTSDSTHLPRQNNSAACNKTCYAALLPRRGPHIASHSVCPSVCLSVCPSVPLSLPRVTSRHLANYNDTHVLFGTHRGPHIVRPSRPHKFVYLISGKKMKLYISSKSTNFATVAQIGCHYLNFNLNLNSINLCNSSNSLTLYSLSLLIDVGLVTTIHVQKEAKSFFAITLKIVHKFPSNFAGSCIN